MSLIKKALRVAKSALRKTPKQKIAEYEKGGRVAWSIGYAEYKTAFINEKINDVNFLVDFDKGVIPAGHGLKLDERVVEYPWVFSRLRGMKYQTILDAGSTFNFEHILSNEAFKEKELTIYTFHPESKSFPQKKINYVYGDIRRMLFKDNYFDVVMCISTIEHIDMDNSIYGYSSPNGAMNQTPSSEYLVAIKELIRVLKPGGILMVSFPFGKYENHGFFQQFDKGMVSQLINALEGTATVLEEKYFLYLKSGWISATQTECANSASYNPHTKVGDLGDGAAHCRAVCCLQIQKR